MQSLQKISWYDNLRALATIGVIGIHVSSGYVPVTGTISATDFWIGNLFDSLSRFAVPIFVMLSGALLLSKEYSIDVFLKKRMIRILLPFLFWSLAYIANSIANDFLDGSYPGLIDIAKSLFINFRDGSTPHFWYIYMIIGLYLFIPIIGKAIRHSTEKEMLYFLCIWLGVIILNQPVFVKFKPQIDFTYFSGYLGYLVLGYFLANKTLKSEKQSNVLGILLIVFGLLSTVLGTFIIHLKTNEYVSTFYEPLSPNILLYASGLFLLCKNRDLNYKPFVLFRNFISKYSYGIFLVHVLVLSKLDDFGIRWNFIHPIIGIPFTIVVCLIISAVIVFLIHKIPYGKYISG